MPLSRPEAETITREAVAALQGGDAASGRRSLERVIDAGFTSPQLWLMLAEACRLTGDAEAEATALDKLLAAEPKNLRGLLMRGDGHARAGEVRAASSFYQAALAAAPPAGSLPQWLAAELQRAEVYLAQSASRYQDALLEKLKAERDAAGPRFAEALDILVGRRQIYPQQPSALYYPGLPQQQYYEREQFAWVPRVEAATDAIRSELLAIINEGADFRPYVEAEEKRPHHDFHGMHGDPSWGAFFLWKDGRIVEENAARCPETMAVLEQAPITRIGARTPSVLFSLLRPGAHIPPHHGMLNCRLICHLPLIVPPGCWLRVGNETREWEEGKLLLFDDSIEHEARNGSDRIRVVLLFDIWRPELSEAERRGVSAIFDSIDAFGA